MGEVRGEGEGDEGKFGFGLCSMGGGLCCGGDVGIWGEGIGRGGGCGVVGLGWVVGDDVRDLVGLLGWCMRRQGGRGGVCGIGLVVFEGWGVWCGVKPGVEGYR